ncbi:hypothetical protein VN12_14760 [Pirellula sp. SH-Sr6A]|uniref:GlsB/YeaQ/YmgE family stress response membrane protein n=1 Tax=Pirellula sp. SH-Sr6A TaxID=1632865 RepID=UPI00078CC8C8|nr:hypothetical protein [Pirellula sp. SH-Sr6A]AMV33384.1 hypothetical protein VN12_14760 [Pirellula sp. SH-Sr6A]
MSWLTTVLVGILGSMVGGGGMFGIALLCVKWYRISSFEGGSGYFVIGLTLLGALCGLIVSMIAGRIAHHTFSTHWSSQWVASLAAEGVILLLVLLAAYSGVDRIPELDGQPIDVIWEIRLPRDTNELFLPPGPPASWEEEHLRLEFVSVSNHKSRGWELARFDRDLFRLENEQWILVAKVPLFTSKGEFCVNLTLGGRDDGFWPAMKPVPTAASFEWSNWFRTNKSKDQSLEISSIMVRFRFEKRMETVNN